jgi:DNA polymerase (family 10)
MSGAVPVGEPADDNARVADMLREAAMLLAAQEANPFRVAAYRKAADTIVGLTIGVRRLFDEQGRAGLDALPSIGPGIAAAVAEILVSGRWSQLDRLRGSTDARHLFASIPGIGTELSERIHDEIGVDTLEALEAAAHDGRLEGVRGVGPRRASAIRAVLAQRLARVRAARSAGVSASPEGEPAVDVLLDVDREYRAKAHAGELPTIAPRRFNPRGEAWLPVLHTQRAPWHFTALYSNTARAHELGREHDWVVVYFYDGDHVERQNTVVTETHGPLVGRRVVRGREHACRDWYDHPVGA